MLCIEWQGNRAEGFQAASPSPNNRAKWQQWWNSLEKYEENIKEMKKKAQNRSKYPYHGRCVERLLSEAVPQGLFHAHFYLEGKYLDALAKLCSLDYICRIAIVKFRAWNCFHQIESIGSNLSVCN